MRVQRVKELQAAIHAIEQGWEGPGDRQRGAFHEWIGVAGETAVWVPPLAVLLWLARRALDHVSGGGGVVWVGRRVWPYPETLRHAGLLASSIFVDQPDGGSRLWAVDLAARSPATAAVVADGRGLDMAATRRLQLAAESGSTQVLCARPPGEITRPSAAGARWLVRCAPSPDRNPRWIVELLRCKGMQPEVFAAPGGSRHGLGRRWTLEWKRAQGGVDVHASLVDRPARAAAPARRSA